MMLALYLFKKKQKTKTFFLDIRRKGKHKSETTLKLETTLREHSGILFHIYLLKFTELEQKILNITLPLFGIIYKIILIQPCFHY